VLHGTEVPTTNPLAVKCPPSVIPSQRSVSDAPARNLLRPTRVVPRRQEIPCWTAALHIRLTACPGATGRPDEVLSALGLADVPRRCTRMRLFP